VNDLEKDELRRNFQIEARAHVWLQSLLDKQYANGNLPEPASLLGKLTCADMENADLAYSPPFSPVHSTIIVAAGILKNKLV